METVWWSNLETRLGTLGLAASEHGLLAIFLPREAPDHHRSLERLIGPFQLVADEANTYLRAAREQLREYVAGERRRFSIQLDQRGTPFQRRVWDAVSDVPWGQTVSYLEIARRIGNPQAVRAVGAANGANPHPIVVPCHRIIGADGTLTGYGGGIDLKRQLLELEGVAVAGSTASFTRPLFPIS